MGLPGTVVTADEGLLGFDTDTRVTPSAAAELFAEGFRFCLRYVSLDAQQDSTDLAVAEATNLLRAGFAIMPVQHVREAPWVPSKDLGGSDGDRAAHHSLVLGFPAGVNVWCDLEGVDTSVSHQSVIDHCNAWFDAVAAAGFVPGVYVGADCLLDGNELRFRLKFAHYWKSLSQVPDIAGRGYQMIQSKGTTVGGIAIDKNRTQADKLGGKVSWLSPTSITS
jgi:hypothetical protein